MAPLHSSEQYRHYPVEALAVTRLVQDTPALCSRQLDRLRICAALYPVREIEFGVLLTLLDMSKSALSKHLSALAEAATSPPCTVSSGTPAAQNTSTRQNQASPQPPPAEPGQARPAGSGPHPAGPPPSLKDPYTRLQHRLRARQYSAQRLSQVKIPAGTPGGVRRP